MAFAAEVTELTTGTEKHLQPVETEEEDQQVVGLERPDSADSSTITTTITSSSSSFSGDGERVTIETLEVHEHDDVNNGNVYLDVDQGAESSDAESDVHESQTVDHLNGKKKVTEFEKGSSSEENKGSREIDEVQDGDIPEEVELIEEEEVDIEDVKDYKAKELLENHKTPNLLCPNCKTCITKVIVLKKRVLLKKKFAPKKKKENPTLVESPAARPRETDDILRSGDNLTSTVGGENPIPGSFFYKCFSCFSIFNIEPKAVDSNPVPPSEFNVGINTQLKPPQEPTGCSNWIVSMLKKNGPVEAKAMPSVDPEASRPRDNHTPLVETAAPTEAPLTSGPYDSTVEIPPTIAEPLLTPVVEGRKPEILKSIVYGGLTEAITSLGVISSAAGSGASTLNILVLGLANLFSGLILIIHNLKELKEEEPIRETTEVNGEEETRYKRLLGRRENFMLHATIAILSFIITGLLPPVVYYFSFKETHNKDYKVASVFGASLICITFLALAKAHVSNPRGSYTKSVLYYAMNAVSVSGITYVAGNVVNQLLEKYGWSDGSETPVGEMMLSLMGRKAGGEAMPRVLEAIRPRDNPNLLGEDVTEDITSEVPPF
ncbi:hypothetical protein Bca52824_070128 [Brassica carinata]|uniref:Membrane protein of ER body-like protein n=1 Tax=Brassica carinata TaxID=52824 RepID=A0A8X7Q8N5_BRACI|nr:hypothetical protein Bca52824_070128 [Brassica carinata]